MGRMFAMALAAVGLSVGGFELGKHRVAPPDVAPLEIPADHPLAVALQPAVATEIAPRTRENLFRIAEDLYRDQSSVKSGTSAPVQRKLDERAREMAIVERRLAAIKSQVVADEARQRKGAAQNQRLAALRVQLEERQREIAEARRQVAEVQAEVDRQTSKEALDRISQKYEKMALDQMTPELRERVKASVRTRRDMDEERGFGLLLALRNRDALSLTPRQVTQLQLLQAEFIRRFAPIREAYESRVDELSWRLQRDAIVAEPSSPSQPPQNPSAKPYLVKPGSQKYFIEYAHRTQPEENGAFTYEIETVNRIDRKESRPQENSEFKHFLWQYPKYVVTKDPPKGMVGQKNSVIRYFVWTDDAELERMLALLKQEIDARAMAILTNAQRKSLQEMIDRSLASGK